MCHLSGAQQRRTGEQVFPKGCTRMVMHACSCVRACVRACVLACVRACLRVSARVHAQTEHSFFGRAEICFAECSSKPDERSLCALCAYGARDVRMCSFAPVRARARARVWPTGQRCVGGGDLRC